MEEMNEALAVALSSNGAGSSVRSRGPKPKHPHNQTIQVKIGSHAPQSMTPDQAAEYLKSIANTGGFDGSSSGAGRDVKMTFGKGPTAASLTTELAADVSSLGGGNILHNYATAADTNAAVGTAIPFGPRRSIGGDSEHADFVFSSNSALSTLDFAALAAVGGADLPHKRKDGAPCTEKEMKALMSMFVEIMGLQMKTDQLQPPMHVRGDVLQAFPSQCAPPPSGWPEELLYPALPPTLNDDDSLPDLEEAPVWSFASLGKLTALLEQTPPVPERFNPASGIERLNWDLLERFAMEDALEQEERARKSAKYVSQQQSASRQASQARSEAEAVAKRLDKVFHAWRSKVVSAINVNDVDALEVLLVNSPSVNDERVAKTHWRALAPQLLAKNRQTLPKNRQARVLLATLLGRKSIDLLLEPQRNGRSVLHTACFHGDIALVQALLSSWGSASEGSDEKQKKINVRCQDSGWTPLQYAVASGSMRVVELILQHGADMLVPTNDTHTWKRQGKGGLTAVELTDVIRKQAWSKQIESHGMALPEITKDLLSGIEARFYLERLAQIAHRLREVASQGNSIEPLSEKQLSKLEEQVRQQATKTRKPEAGSVTSNDGSLRKQESMASNTPRRSSSKAQKNYAETLPVSKIDTKNITEPVTKSVPEDPMISALIGMGFVRDQIMNGVHACGGMDRATADDVVAWIFGQDTSPAAPDESPKTIEDQPASQISGGIQSRDSLRHARAANAAEVTRLTTLRKAEEERLAAERQAAHREEQRRKNREWNNRQKRQVQTATAADVKRSSGGLEGKALPPRSLSKQISGMPDKGPIPAAMSATATAPTSTWVNREVRENGNDSSTVNSFNEITTIEIYNNDDATVSTIGSLQARATSIPVPSSQPVAPPGFGLTVPAVPEAMEATHPWGLTPAGVPHLPGNDGPGCFLPPPGLSADLNSMQHPAISGASERQFPMKNDPMAGGSISRSADSFTRFATGNNGTGLLRSHLMSTTNPPVDPSLLFSDSLTGNSFRNNLSQQTCLPPLPSQSFTNGSSFSGPTLPSSLGIGRSGLPNQAAHLDSSFIESISTGDPLLDGASLWGGIDPQSQSPSVLHNLLHEDLNHDGIFPAPQTSEQERSFATWGTNQQQSHANLHLLHQRPTANSHQQPQSLNVASTMQRDNRGRSIW
jgi:hypothetical protein